MGKDLNKVQLIGYLGADPEMRYTAQGTAVANARLATSNRWTDRDGKGREETTWHSLVIWNKLAEIVNEYAGKGSRIYVEGRLQTRAWTDRDNQERMTTEVVVEDLILLDSRRAAAGQAEDAPAEDAPGARERPAPSRPAAPAAARPRGGSAPNDPSYQRPPARPARAQAAPIAADEDIPF